MESYCFDNKLSRERNPWQAAVTHTQDCHTFESNHNQKNSRPPEVHSAARGRATGERSGDRTEKANSGHGRVMIVRSAGCLVADLCFVIWRRKESQAPASERKRAGLAWWSQCPEKKIGNRLCTKRRSWTSPTRSAAKAIHKFGDWSTRESDNDAISLI